MLILMSLSWRTKKWRPSVPLGPTEEHVAGGLHEPVAVHDPLAVVGKDARTRVRLQHRGAGLLHLEEERIALAGHEEEHEADRSRRCRRPTTLTAASRSS